MMDFCRCLKSMIGESMDLPTQALALGYLSLSWGFGTILGMIHDHPPCNFAAHAGLNTACIGCQTGIAVAHGQVLCNGVL